MLADWQSTTVGMETVLCLLAGSRDCRPHLKQQMPNVWAVISQIIVTLPLMIARPCLLVTVSKINPRTGHEGPDGE